MMTPRPPSAMGGGSGNGASSASPAATAASASPATSSPPSTSAATKHALPPPGAALRPNALITASAPGKLILFGEHAVVYGQPALAVACGLRTSAAVSVAAAGDSTVRLRLADFEVEPGDGGRVLQWDGAWIRQAVGSASGGDSLRPAAAAAGTLRSLREIAGAAARAGGGAEEGGAAHWRAAVPAAVASAALGFLFLYTSVVLARRGADAEAPLALGLDVVVRSELPVGAGMGSSGSYCVAVAAALLAAARVCPLPLTTADGVPDDATRHLINGWAFRAEGIFHGTPSGIDNTVSSFGGCLRFRRLPEGGNDTEFLPEVPLLNCLVINTHVPRDTSALVTSVGRLYHDCSQAMAPMLEAFGGVVGSAGKALALLAADAESPQGHSELARLVVMNHHLLCAIGVGHPACDTVCSLCAEAGVDAKITGAGGGGCMLAVLRPEVKPAAIEGLSQALRAEGCTVLQLAIGAVGVTLAAERRESPTL